MAIDGRIEAWNLPLGVISHLCDIAAGLPGNLTPVGLGTFVDPRLQGGKVNARTTDDLVELTQLAGRELLLYRARRRWLSSAPRCPTRRATSRSTRALTQDALAIAMAVKNAGGVVIAQVAHLATGALHTRHVKVPGILVDCVVVAQPENHRQTFTATARRCRAS